MILRRHWLIGVLQNEPVARSVNLRFPRLSCFRKLSVTTYFRRMRTYVNCSPRDRKTNSGSFLLFGRRALCVNQTWLSFRLGGSASVDRCDELREYGSVSVPGQHFGFDRRGKWSLFFFFFLVVVRFINRISRGSSTERCSKTGKVLFGSAFGRAITPVAQFYIKDLQSISVCCDSPACTRALIASNYTLKKEKLRTALLGINCLAKMCVYNQTDFWKQVK